MKRSDNQEIKSLSAEEIERLRDESRKRPTIKRSIDTASTIRSMSDRQRAIMAQALDLIIE